jgi:hypothetical protein
MWPAGRVLNSWSRGTLRPVRYIRANQYHIQMFIFLSLWNTDVASGCNEIQQSYSEFDGQLLSCPHKQWLEFLPPSQCVFRLFSLPLQFMSRHVWMARVSGGLTLLLVEASPHKNLHTRLLVAMLVRTGCRFYGVPEHGSGHRMLRQMQVFCAIKLQCSGTR